MIKSVMSTIHITLTTFKNIIENQGFKLIDISFNEINGGSIEVICAKKKSKIKSKKKKLNLF